MTELEWLTATDTWPMIDFLRGKVSERKVRLYGLARCRQFLHLLTDERCRMALEVGERYADGQAKIEELRAALEEAWTADSYAQTPSARVTLGAASESDPAGESFWDTAWDFYETSGLAERAAMDSTSESEILLLRCVVGNPFRSLSVDPTWRTSTVIALAQGIYDERAFDRLPILADALQDAGCDTPEVLEHCRDAGPHSRGCWPIDLILEKSSARKFS